MQLRCVHCRSVSCSCTECMTVCANKFSSFLYHVSLRKYCITSHQRYHVSRCVWCTVLQIRNTWVYLQVLAQNSESYVRLQIRSHDCTTLTRACLCCTNSWHSCLSQHLHVACSRDHRPENHVLKMVSPTVLREFNQFFMRQMRFHSEGDQLLWNVYRHFYEQGWVISLVPLNRWPWCNDVLWWSARHHRVHFWSIILNFINL